MLQSLVCSVTLFNLEIVCLVPQELMSESTAMRDRPQHVRCVVYLTTPPQELRL